jgi:hypothetical protein
MEYMISRRKASIFRAWINPGISLVFVSVFSLGAFLLVWNIAFGENPVANAMASAIERETVLPTD